jgi:hypothetical protein
MYITCFVDEKSKKLKNLSQKTPKRIGEAMEPPTPDPTLKLNPPSMIHCRRVVSDALLEKTGTTLGNLNPGPIMKGNKRVQFDPNRQRMFNKAVWEGYLSGEVITLEGK